MSTQIKQELELLELLDKMDMISQLMIYDTKTKEVWGQGNSNKKMSMEEFENLKQYSPHDCLFLLPDNKR